MKKLIFAGVISTATLALLGSPITASFCAGMYTAIIAWRAAK